MFTQIMLCVITFLYCWFSIRNGGVGGQLIIDGNSIFPQGMDDIQKIGFSRTIWSDHNIDDSLFVIMKFNPFHFGEVFHKGEGEKV